MRKIKIIKKIRKSTKKIDLKKLPYFDTITVYLLYKI